MQVFSSIFQVCATLCKFVQVSFFLNNFYYTIFNWKRISVQVFSYTMQVFTSLCKAVQVYASVSQQNQPYHFKSAKTTMQVYIFKYNTILSKFLQVLFSQQSQPYHLILAWNHHASCVMYHACLSKFVQVWASLCKYPIYSIKHWSRSVVL